MKTRERESKKGEELKETRREREKQGVKWDQRSMFTSTYNKEEHDEYLRYRSEQLLRRGSSGDGDWTNPSRDFHKSSEEGSGLDRRI